MASKEEKRFEAEIIDSKLLKAKCKSAFTKTKNKILRLLQVEDADIDRQQIRSLQEHLDTLQDNVVEVIEKLCSLYKECGDNENAQKVTEELDVIDSDYNETHQKVYEVFKSGSFLSLDSNVEVKEQKQHELGHDMYKQLKRVSIPTFNGDKHKYESWKSAFNSCIDSAPATKEYKLLQLRQYLSGEALKAIDSLGHTGTSYDIAKERLERKFGGKRRQIACYLEDLDKFPIMKEENAKKNIEKFADIFDIAVINLKEAEREDDLSNGVLYLRLQKKMPETMLTRYHRWIFESGEDESFETLRQWLNKESEYHTIASETVHCMSQQDSKKQGQQSESMVYYNESTPKSTKQPERKCSFCQGSHGIWECGSFKALNVTSRWDKAKELNLCYRCLGSHMAKMCKQTRICAINSCKTTHHRLLHKTVLNP